MQAEVLYGVLGSSGRLSNDPEAAIVMLHRIYNDWLHDFCKAAPDRLVTAWPNLPNYDMDESVTEAMRSLPSRGSRRLRHRQPARA